MDGLLNEWERTARHLRAAESFLNKNLDEEAARRLDQALKVSPDNRIALKRRMELLLREENPEAALPLCLKLLEQDSSQFSLKTTLLETLQQHGEPAAVHALADHMLEQQPNHLPILKIAAFSRIEQNRVEEALAIYKRILERVPTDPVALAGAALIHRSRQEWADAVSYYQELLNVNPSAEVYGALSRCYARLGEAGKAVIFMGQAASLYGEKTVAGWFPAPEFDAVRETIDFRAFADRVVGVETRKAIEAIREREADETRPAIELPGGGLGLPDKPDLQILKPGN
jgi:tetratricopeptide (TPR) repeat protein